MSNQYNVHAIFNLQEPYDSELVSHKETASRDTGRPSAFSGTKVGSNCTADDSLQHNQVQK